MASKVTVHIIRYFDSSFLYNKEETLGRVIEAEVAVLSKLPQNGMKPETVERFLLKSLTRLRLDYLDMYLIHFPTGTINNGNDENTHPLDNEGFLMQVVQ